MKPPISGAYMGETYRAAASRVESHLLLGRGEGVGDLQAPLLAEDEPQLLGRAKPVRMGGPERRTGAGIRYGAEALLMEEAVLAARLHCPCPPVSHAHPRSSV